MSGLDLTGKHVGMAMSASHHNLETAFDAAARLHSAGAELTFILSHSITSVETKHGHPGRWLNKARTLGGKEPLTSFPAVEPLGPDQTLDCLCVCPCTGNTLASLANSLSGSLIVFAAKSQWRNGGPVVLAVSTNDGLGLNAINLGRLLAAQHTFFVPFGQDNPQVKPRSISAHWDQLGPTVEAALDGEQLQPLLQEY